MPDPLPSGSPQAGPVAPTAPVPAGTSPEATPQQPAGTTQVEIDVLKAQLEAENKRNISRLQSSLMSQQETNKRQWETEREEYERKLAESYMSGMDEKERGEYERDLLRNRLATMEQKLSVSETEKQQTASMVQSAAWFMQMGVKPDTLDWSTPESLAQTGTEALQAHVKSMEQRLAEFANKPAPATHTPATPSQPAATPTPVVTTNTGTPSTVSTFEDIRRGLQEQLGKPVTDEDVFKYAERSPSVRTKLNELAQAEAERRALARGAEIPLTPFPLPAQE